MALERQKKKKDEVGNVRAFHLIITITSHDKHLHLLFRKVKHLSSGKVRRGC